MDVTKAYVCWPSKDNPEQGVEEITTGISRIEPPTPVGMWFKDHSAVDPRFLHGEFTDLAVKCAERLEILGDSSLCFSALCRTSPTPLLLRRNRSTTIIAFAFG